LTESIFTESQETTPSSEANAYEALVGEGKKFKSPEDLAKGKVEADRFIAQLQSELAELRNEGATRARLEEIVDRLTSQERAQEGLNQEPNQRSFESPNSQPQSSQADIERLIDQRITKREQRQTAEQNKRTVIDNLKQTFGSDYLAKLEARRAELGLEQSEMDNLAARSPNAFMALVAPNQKPQSPSAPPSSQVSTQALLNNHQASQAAPGTKAFYDALKKSDPNRYWSTEVQWQMHKDAIKAAKEGKNF